VTGRGSSWPVPGLPRLVGLGRVDDANKVLQPELPAVLGVVPGPLDIGEQVPVGRFRQREQPPVGDQAAVAVPAHVSASDLVAVVEAAGYSAEPAVSASADSGFSADGFPQFSA